MLLNDTFQDLGSRFAVRGVERDHDAAFVYFGNADPGLVAQAQDTANPIQLIEGRTTLEIHKQVWPKAPRVRLGLGFLANALDSLPADELDVSDIKRAAIVS